MRAKIQSKLNLEDRIPLQDVMPLDTPFLLYVDPSSACNFRCQFCPTGHKDLVKNSEYIRSVLDFELFKKLINDLGEFDQPIKVMRLNKIGEPTLNKNLSKMVGYAKKSGFVKYIDFATNGSLLTHDHIAALIDAGLDRLNISLEGVNVEQYMEYAKVDIDFDVLVKNIYWLYENKNQCEVSIKIPGNYLDEAQKKHFFDIFGDHCDRIFIEEIAPIWPSFDVEKRSGIKIQKEHGQYKLSLEEKVVCAPIFYAMSINADGSVSACCPDWDQKLIIGNIQTDSVHSIWHSSKMNELRKLHLEGRRHENFVCKDCGHIRHAQIDNIDPYKEVLLKKIFK